MKNKYDIRQKLTELNEEAINLHKDFEGLLAQLDEAKKNDSPPELRVESRRSAYRPMWVAAASLLFILTASLLWWTKSTPVETAQNFINPPLKNIPAEGLTRSLNADTGDTLLYAASGSRVIVPANAFVHADGSAVHGQVDLHYNEYQDLADLFMSGIPNDEHLSFAGIVEVTGSQNGQPIFVSEGKTLDIQLITSLDQSLLQNNNLPPFAVYDFNEKTGVWTYYSPDSIRILERTGGANTTTTVQNNTPTEENANPNRIEGLLPRPVEPKLLNPKHYHFRLDVLPEEYPEIVALQDMVWEVTAENGFKNEWYDEPWNTMDLSKEKEGLYMLHLESDKLKLDMNVIPVVTERDYNAAMQAYKKDLAAYNAQQAKLSPTNSNQPIASTSTSEKQQVKFLNTFRLNHLGVWACAAPVKTDLIVKLRPEFQTTEGTPLAIQRIYLATEGLNTVLAFAPNAEVPYQANRRHLLWVLTTDGRIAVCSPERFPQHGETSYIFKLELPADQSKTTVKRLIAM